MSIGGPGITTEKRPKINCLSFLQRKGDGQIDHVFQEVRNVLIIVHRIIMSEEGFLIRYEECESVNPLYPYWEFDPFCLDLD